MRCPRCQKRLPEGDNFCVYCGALVTPPATPPPAPTLTLDNLVNGTLGSLAGAPLLMLAWLLLGWPLGMELPLRLLAGGLVGLLGGGLGGALATQLTWPLAQGYRRTNPAHLGRLYGLGGAVALALSAPLIGSIVLLLGWTSTELPVAALVMGAVVGLLSLPVAAPLSALLGALVGWAAVPLGLRLGGLRWAAVGAGLAWLAGGPLGGTLLAAVLATRAELPLGWAALVGALLPALVAAALLPVGVRVVWALTRFLAWLP